MIQKSGGRIFGHEIFVFREATESQDMIAPLHGGDLFAHANRLPDQRSNAPLKPERPSPNTQARIIARAKRDRPDLLKRLEAG